MLSIVKRGGVLPAHRALVRPSLEISRRSLSVIPSLLDNGLLSPTPQQRIARQSAVELGGGRRLPWSAVTGSPPSTSSGANVPSAVATAPILQQHRFLSSQPPPGGMNLGNIFNNAQNNANKKPGETLEQYGVDLTKMAKEGKLDPVIGRHEEIRRTLQILGEIDCIEFNVRFH